ncbi:MAG: hypothetical protein ACFFDC_12410 [Promethearchaeota archaeon]
MVSNAEYIAGNCNIGSAEIAQRRRIGFIALAILGVGFLIYMFGVFSLNFSPLLGILFIFPSTIAAIGFIQARQKFCAAYGFSSVTNVSVHLGATMKIEDEIERRKDRNKAIIITLQSIFIGAVVTIVITILGFII